MDISNSFFSAVQCAASNRAGGYAWHAASNRFHDGDVERVAARVDHCDTQFPAHTVQAVCQRSGFSLVDITRKTVAAGLHVPRSMPMIAINAPNRDSHTGAKYRTDCNAQLAAPIEIGFL